MYKYPNEQMIAKHVIKKCLLSLSHHEKQFEQKKHIFSIFLFLQILQKKNHQP
jgi:hypothetical protein